jgi:hypothetical protein
MTEEHSLQDSNELMWLKFIGPDLHRRSLPIYELGQSLVSMQRIINKAYLYRHDRLFHSSGLTPVERRMVSLQVVSREKASDAYGLAPFVLDPLAQQLLAELIAAGIVGIASYVFQRLRGRLSNSVEATSEPLTSRPHETSFAISIYPEVSELVARIGNVGGTSVIQITTQGRSEQTQHIEITPETKSYVNAIEGEIALGATMIFTAKPWKLIPEQNVIEVRRGKKQRTIKVIVPSESFDRIRYHPEKDVKVEFIGRPVFRLGAKLTTYSEFEAVSAEIVGPFVYS